MAIGSASLAVLSTDVVEAAPSLASITGTVKDENGTPLAGAVVALLEPQLRGKEIKSVRTDSAGKFSTQVSPGFYWLRVVAEGFAATRLHIKVFRPVRANYDFALKRTDTLVQKRTDSDDYRWVGRSVPRHVLRWKDDPTVQPATDQPESQGQTVNSDLLASRLFAHGMAEFAAVSSASRPGLPGANSFGSNFALSSNLPGNVEMVLIGQRGFGQMAPQRFSAIASMRPSSRHQFTASIGYGQFWLAQRKQLDLDDPNLATELTAGAPRRNGTLEEKNSRVYPAAHALDQLSVSAMASWQMSQPLLIIYGFDYSRFMGSTSKQRDSVLPRFAVQYSPASSLRINAAMTPGTDQRRQSMESFQTENIQTGFEETAPEIAFNDYPIPDRSRRMEAGVERLFGNGSSALEASAFYDLISGHGVGLLALPLEVSPETQATFEQVAHQVAAMNGTARGIRVIYKHNLNRHLSTAVGYSFGRGTRFGNDEVEPMAPGEMFKNGFFQIATAKLDLDLSSETGTHISTVIRLSPSAVVFAIDPFAGRMSVYDPNINVYVTQDLPNFGLPVHWQVLVDLRNLLDQSSGMEDGVFKLIAARSRRTVRGGLAFRW
ncbi:MAG TPA: TonB-dependent receptor [Blastocatellia bacterium]|nr:TonB-dependent receptor [Blastocatellia bacterium]